jgi:anti-anti-sigma factor
MRWWRSGPPWQPICFADPFDNKRGDGGSTLIVEKKHLENFTILYVEGLIKLGESAEFFSSALENVLKNESTNVIIDFTKIDYIDSTGIGELVGYLGKFTTQNRKLILVNPSERIQRLLKLAKLDAVFKIYESEDEAVAAEAGGAATTSA